MSKIAEKLAEAEEKQYLQESWGGYVLAAGYENITLTKEESLDFGGKIARVAGQILELKGHWATIEQVRSLTAEQKKSIRDVVVIYQPQFEPKGYL